MLSRVVRSCISLLRDAHWLSRARVRAYSAILLAITLCLTVGWVFASRGGLDPLGKPLGTDFTSFWAASKLTLSGHPTQVYNVAVHAATERAVFGGAHVGYSAFFYPPLYLLICLPLALTPYLAALAVWLGASGYLCGRTIRSLLGDAGVGLWATLLAFPGVLSNVGHGQNAFLTAALFGLAVLNLDRRPLLAGVFLGLLAFKPHLGLVMPVALLATGRWKTLVAAALTLVAFVSASALAFGIDTWRAFLAISPLARTALEQNLVGFEKMQSTFAAARLLHAGVGLAYVLQAAVSLIACAIVVMVGRTRSGDGTGLALGATLAAASLLASPFLLDYDLMILAIPMAWIAREAARTGFMPWEKTALFAAFILPLVSRVVGAGLGVPIGPPVILALLVVVANRAMKSPPTPPGNHGYAPDPFKAAARPLRAARTLGAVDLPAARPVPKCRSGGAFGGEARTFEVGSDAWP